MVGTRAAVLGDAPAKLRIHQYQRVAQHALCAQVVIERLQAIVERGHQVEVRALVDALRGVSVEAAGLHPEDLGANLLVHGAGDRGQSLAQTVIGIRGGRPVGGDGRDPVQRVHGGLRLRIHERQVRAVNGDVRRDAGLCRAFVGGLDAGVRAGERVRRRAGDRRHADQSSHQRAGRFALRVPGNERVDRHLLRVEVAAKPAGARRIRRARRAPDVEAGEM